jgi:hypothetical protein
MTKTLPIVALGALLLALAYAEEESSTKCDLKTVVKAFYCDTCDAVLEKKDLVSDVTIYVCEECETVSRTAGRCECCDEPLTKKKSGKDVCRQCLNKPAPAEACRKVYFECPECEAPSAIPGTCEDCDTAFVQKVSLALVTYDCPVCGDSRLQAGKCEDEDCKHFGKPLVRTCSASGEFPHVAK